MKPLAGKGLEQRKSHLMLKKNLGKRIKTDGGLILLSGGEKSSPHVRKKNPPNLLLLENHQARAREEKPSGMWLVRERNYHSGPSQEGKTPGKLVVPLRSGKTVWNYALRGGKKKPAVTKTLGLVTRTRGRGRGKKSSSRSRRKAWAGERFFDSKKIGNSLLSRQAPSDLREKGPLFN